MRLLGILTLGSLMTASLLLGAEDPPEAHVKLMKEIGKLSGNLRKGIDVEASASKIAALGPDVDKFWAKRSETGAKTTKDMIAAATALAAAAKSNDSAAVAEASKQLGGSCKGCHDAHREKVSEGVYKIK